MGWDGRFRQLSVRSSKPGAQVRAEQAITAEVTRTRGLLSYLSPAPAYSEILPGHQTGLMSLSDNTQITPDAAIPKEPSGHVLQHPLPAGLMPW